MNESENEIKTIRHHFIFKYERYVTFELIQTHVTNGFFREFQAKSLLGGLPECGLY